MAKYRKKPVVIEAIQYTTKNVADVLAFCPVAVALTGLIEIETMEGWMDARPGAWIIKGVQGEFYPCKADVFAATYELAEVSDG